MNESMIELRIYLLNESINQLNYVSINERININLNIHQLITLMINLKNWYPNHCIFQFYHHNDHY